MLFQGRKTETALVTGASSGIGSALARELARRGFHIVLTARREHRLEAVARDISEASGVHTTVITEDLSDPGATARLVEKLSAEGITIDALVNNAGYGIAGRFQDTPLARHRDFVRVLVTSGVELAYLLLPGMIKRGYGRIINVCSAAALVPSPGGYTLYAATKAFMLKFSESLHLENLETGVHVTALCPGLTRSEFHQVAGVTEETDRIPDLFWTEADSVARDACAAVMRNRVVCVPGRVNRWIHLMTRLLPRTDRLRSDPPCLPGGALQIRHTLCVMRHLSSQRLRAMTSMPIKIPSSGMCSVS